MLLICVVTWDALCADVYIQVNNPAMKRDFVRVLKAQRPSHGPLSLRRRRRVEPDKFSVVHCLLPQCANRLQFY